MPSHSHKISYLQLLSMYAIGNCIADANAKYAADVAAALADKLPAPPPPDLDVLCTPNYAALDPTITPNWEGDNPYDSLSTAQVCSARKVCGCSHLTCRAIPVAALCDKYSIVRRASLRHNLPTPITRSNATHRPSRRRSAPPSSAASRSPTTSSRCPPDPPSTQARRTSQPSTLERPHAWARTSRSPSSSGPRPM